MHTERMPVFSRGAWNGLVIFTCPIVLMGRMLDPLGSVALNSWLWCITAQVVKSQSYS